MLIVKVFSNGCIVRPSFMFTLFVSFMFLPSTPSGRKQINKDLITPVKDMKDFKKLLRTRNNVLIIFHATNKDLNKDINMLAEVAENMRGLATLSTVNCGEHNKICKKEKATAAGNLLKHYKDGKFHMDYDRLHSVKSVTNFLRDPTGDIPWDEDSSAKDVRHIDTQQQLQKLLRTEKKPLLVMFYAPWCGFCKKLKPDYAEAAMALRESAVLAGMDVDKPELSQLKMEFNITGYPTIYYFQGGKLLFPYGGESTKEGLISWMNDPHPPKAPEKEQEWSEEDNDVTHLTSETFQEYISANPSVLVMFYAPWCGHCKAMKPEYAEAAAVLKSEELGGTLAAVDATKDKELVEKFGINGYPTLKYFKGGAFAWDFNDRKKDQFISFIRDPKEPPPPPPPEPLWEDLPSEVVHLNAETFKQALKKKKHVLVMFYAPWCGHCKKAKPEFMQAAEEYKDDSKVMFAAVDCTQHSAVCQDVQGYPTFKYFNYGRSESRYSGGREKADFVKFIRDPTSPKPLPTQLLPQEFWQGLPGAEHIVTLNSNNFHTFISENPSVMVMFYAPWCGHCQAMKPAYAQSALYMFEKKLNHVLAVVDATAEAALKEEFEISGFPSIKYFRDGSFLTLYSRSRTAESIIEFLVSPPEPTWSDTGSAVFHLDVNTLPDFVDKRSTSFIMFYVPWCNYSKAAQPIFQSTAEALPHVSFAAIDCDADKVLCKSKQISEYPSFLLYQKGKLLGKFNGERTQAALTEFVSSKLPRQEL